MSASRTDRGLLRAWLVAFSPGGTGDYLLYSALAEQAGQPAAALPGALSQLAERAGRVANDPGLNKGGEGAAMSPHRPQRTRGVRCCSPASSYSCPFPLPGGDAGTAVVGLIVRLFPPEKRAEFRDLLSEVRTSVLGWLGGQLVAMTVLG